MTITSGISTGSESDMTDKVQVTITFTYDLPDGADRQRAYGTLDPQHCVEMDAENVEGDYPMLLDMATSEPMASFTLIKDEV
jgi:hypothetical protein